MVHISPGVVILYGVANVKKRIEIFAVACLLVLGAWLIPGGRTNNTTVESVQETEIESDAEAETEGEADAESDAEVETESEAEVESDAEIETEPETAVLAETGTETDVETEKENDVQPAIATEAEMQVEPEALVPEEFNLIGSYAIADVDRYVNVRNAPSTDGEVVGKIYDDAVAEIVAVAGELEDWFQITSGNVEGYVKSEFFLYGEEAQAVLDQYVVSYAKVEGDRLNVRADQSVDSTRIGRLNSGDKVKLLENCGEWIKIQYTEQKSGYVSAEYVTLTEEYSYAKTLEEDRAEKAARQKRENSGRIPTMTGVFPVTTYTSNEELRTNIINYALQFVGNKYINGGKSLAGGTDCSGFTCYIFKDFGYSISRTPQGQFTGAGRSIDYSEIQPGDIICYSSNGGKSCTHVAFYIGDGQIVHAANSRKGVIVSAADYEPIIGIRNVID